MKRRIFSVITALALCLGLLPGAVSAAEKSMQGIEAVTTMLNFADAKESMSGPGYTWDYETKTLTLENFYQDYTDTSTGTDAIRLPEATDDVTIILKGSNTIRSWSFGIGRGFVGAGVTEVPGSLTIKGSGTLTFEANTAIDVNGTLRIESGELNVRSASSRGIGSYYEDVVITGGILNIESGGSTTAGIFAANGNVVIQGGSIQAVNSGDCGIAGDQGVAISGGQVTVETDGYPGIASLNGKVEISGRAEITSTSQNHRALFGKSGVILSDDRIRDISVNTEASANGAAAWDKTTALNSYKYVKIVPAPVSVTDVQLDKDTLTLQAGETAQLTVSITPVDADDQSVLWTSSNTAVVTVDSSGNVTAVSAGTATITITTTDGGKTASCNVTVTAPAIHVTGITLNKTDLTLTAGDSEQLTATVAPSDATDKSVTWASSNTAVAAVDSSGNVTAVSEGTATITVTTADGAKTAACTVTVRTDSSGGGYVPSDPGDYSSSTITVPVSGDKSTVRVSASVSGTTATVSKIDTTQIDHVIGDNGQASMVEIDFTGLGKTIDTVKLPAAAIKDIAGKAQNEEVRGLTVKLPDGEISFDAKALSAIQAQASNQITLAVTPVKPNRLNSRQKEVVGSAPVFDLTLRSSSGAISDFRGGYATVALPYTLAAGQNPDRVVVYYLDSTGNITPCTTMYDVGRKSAIFTTGHLSLYFVGYAPAAVWVNPFSDVAEGAWYYDAVRYASENSLMAGYDNGRFGPDDTLTRAQFAQILYNKEGGPAVNYPLRYNDVADGAWYTEAVRWATSQGIVSGYGNGMFGPNDNITREQLAVMLWRYAGSPAATEKELHFTDADKISGYALEALRWAVENGVMGGYGNGRLAPQGLATRAQAAQMLMNFLKNK